MYYDEIKKRDQEFCLRKKNNGRTERSVQNEKNNGGTVRSIWRVKNDNKGLIAVIIILAIFAVVLGVVIAVRLSGMGTEPIKLPDEPVAEESIPVITSEPMATPVVTEEPVIETAPPTRGTWENIPEDVKNTITGSSYPAGGNAKISLDQLAYLTIPYKDFNGNTVMDGQMIVAKELADDVLDIFEELYIADYPIEKMYLVDRYGASDYESIENNNTSAFNYRESTDGSGRLSNHALGRAIDINPQQNPYVQSNGTGAHQNAKEYWSRNYQSWKDPVARRAYIGPGTEIYNIFIAHGWQWGGNWSSYRDYQHFEKK